MADGADSVPLRNVAGMLEADGLDRYERFEPVARRDAASILTCRDRRVRRDVVMKRLDGPAASTSARDRFLREARIQAQLEHPGVVPVYDLGADAEGNVYFTAQRASGVTLRCVFDELRGPPTSAKKHWSREKLLGAFRQLCLTVHYAHERGVVHRNLNPEGIVLGDFGEVYLVDWSQARVAASADAPLDLPEARSTQTGRGELIGTPGYAAPEQLIDGGAVDRRADVYALGAILFELLCHKPLHAGTRVEILRSTQFGADARPSTRTPQQRFPRELEEACVKASARDPRLRYATARELHDVVDAFLESDRDAAERRELAARHGSQAEETAVRAIVAGVAGLAQRRTALAQAGRALALDPHNAPARRAIVALLRELPAEMPPEARTRVEEEEAELTRRFARFGAVAYLAFAAATVTVVASGIRSWAGFFFTVAPLLLSSAAWVPLSRQKVPDARVAIAVYGLSSVAIAFSSGLYGALVLVPALIVVQTLGYSFGVLMHRRGLVLSLGVLCLLVPYALERLGVVPPSYVFAEGAFTILPVVRDFPAIPVRVGLMTVSVITFVVLTLLAWNAHDTLSALRQRLYLNMWQVAQLLPGEARSRLSVGSLRSAAIPVAAKRGS